MRILEIIQGLVWFEFFVTWHIDLLGLFNVKAIHVEETMC